MKDFSIFDSVALLPPKLQDRKRDTFAVGLDLVNIAASAVVSGDIKISDDADFVAVYQTYTASNVAGTTFFEPAPFLADIKDSGSGRSISNIPLHINNWFGSARLPGVCAQPKLLYRGSTYTVTLTNLDAGAAYTVRVAFIGYKVYGDRLPAGGV